MQSTPNIVCKVTVPSVRTPRTTPVAIATGARAIRSPATKRPAVVPNSPNPISAAAEPATASATMTVAGLAITGGTSEANRAAIKVAPWSAIAISLAQSSSGAASPKTSEQRISARTTPYRCSQRVKATPIRIGLEHRLQVGRERGRGMALGGVQQLLDHQHVLPLAVQQAMAAVDADLAPATRLD